MREVWCWLGMAFLLIAGCRTTPPNLKPDPQPEQYVLPPKDDPRYDKPYVYSKDPNDPNKFHINSDPGSPGAPGNQNVMPGRGPRSGFGPGGSGGATGY